MSTTTVHAENLRLDLVSADQRLTVALTETATGAAWGPVPLLALDVYDKPLKRVLRVADWRLLQLEPVDHGVHIVVGDPAHGIDVDIWLRLVDGELSVLMAPAECYEKDAVLYRLFAVDLLPGLIAVHHGKLLLPLNTGMLCPTTGAPAVRDRFLIYGEQERWELTPALPYAAGWDNRGGLMALASQGACDAECRVATDGHDGGTVGFAMTLRRTWVDPVDIDHRELRLMPLSAEDDPVHACARRLRRHIVDDLGKRSLAERAAESPEVAYLANAYVMKLFHGIEHVGYMMEGKEKRGSVSFQTCMTFAEATAGLQRLKAAGVDTILTQCVGWNARGHDGLYPTRFPIEERLGGEAGFRAMIRAGNDFGFNIQVHDNFVMQNLASPDFDPDYCIIDLHGDPLIHGRWAGGPEVSGWPLAMPEARLAGHMRRMRDLGLKGMYYVDYMEQPLEVNYHPKHKGPRAACARGQQLILREGRRIFGACGTEFGFLPCALEADHISTCGDPWHLTMCEPHWPVTQLIAPERVVPVWQLAMSGLVALEARRGVTWDNAMRCVLFGGVPRDEWSVRPGVMPVLDDARIAAQKAVYDLCVKRFGHLKFQPLVSVTRDGDRTRTTFADHTTVEADFNSQRLTVNSQDIPRPKALTT